VKLPGKVKVSYIDYSIGEYPKAEATAGKEVGDCDIAINRIRVQVADCSSQHQANTLLHEILHAITHEYNVSFKSEESAVNGFANGLCQVIRDNKDIVKFITGGLNGRMDAGP